MRKPHPQRPRLETRGPALAAGGCFVRPADGATEGAVEAASASDGATPAAEASAEAGSAAVDGAEGDAPADGDVTQ